jgi:hypothetical protein
MKYLKNIQIFEAVESNILSKTLGYICSEDRITFMNQLKKMCKSINFPLSKISDEYFEYLPFKSALYRAAMSGDEPCEATSKSEFPTHAVDGERCTNGTIKRQWGERTRDVVCPVCAGSGVKPKKSELKLIKFWFTSKGKYVNTTLVDGLIRNRFSTNIFSTSISDYTIDEVISNDNMSKLSTGDYVSVSINNENNIIAFIYKKDSKYYAIQNTYDGSSPSGSDWRKYGKYSWMLYGDEYKNMKLLKPKNKEKEEQVNPYSWNTGISFGYYSSNFKLSQQNIDIVETIKDAHFAIVFDLGKLKKSEFETTQDIKSNREERKLDSKLDPNQSDESIKKKNIERYINLISQKIDIADDIANCNRLIIRSLGYKSALYLLVTNINSSLDRIIGDYIKFISATDDVDKKDLSYLISDRTNNLIDTGIKKSSKINEVIKNIKLKLNSRSEDKKYLELLELTQKLSDAIYNNLKNLQINDIEDLEIVNQKINSMKNIIRSNRYGLERYFSYVIENIFNNREDRAYSYLIDNYYTRVDELLKNIPRLITIIDKI